MLPYWLYHAALNINNCYVTPTKSYPLHTHNHVMIPAALPTMIDATIIGGGEGERR